MYIEPRLSTVTLATGPPGLQLTLDGQPVTAPAQFTGVVGVVRTIGASSPQGPYTFDRWSDGGMQVHTIGTPAADTTAIFTGGTTTTSPPTTTTTSSTTSSTAQPKSSTSSTTSTTTRTAAPPAACWQPCRGAGPRRG